MNVGDEVEILEIGDIPYIRLYGDKLIQLIPIKEDSTPVDTSDTIQ